jgi:hypothetical protein
LGLHHFIQQHHQQRHVGLGGRKPLIFFYETNKQIAVHVKARVSSFAPSARHLSRQLPRCEEKDQEIEFDQENKQRDNLPNHNKGKEILVVA